MSSEKLDKLPNGKIRAKQTIIGIGKSKNANQFTVYSSEYSCVHWNNNSYSEKHKFPEEKFLSPEQVVACLDRRGFLRKESGQPIVPTDLNSAHQQPKQAEYSNRGPIPTYMQPNHEIAAPYPSHVQSNWTGYQNSSPMFTSPPSNYLQLTYPLNYAQPNDISNQVGLPPTNYLQPNNVEYDNSMPAHFQSNSHSNQISTLNPNYLSPMNHNASTNYNVPMSHFTPMNYLQSNYMRYPNTNRISLDPNYTGYQDSNQNLTYPEYSQCTWRNAQDMQ